VSSETYFTLDEAASILKLHPQTLRRWIRQGRLFARRVGKQFRLRREDIERAVQPASANVEELSAFEQAALASLADVWDNEEDAIYDRWKELYGDAKG
jgi:excisionase family DNA binding protein